MKYRLVNSLAWTSLAWTLAFTPLALSESTDGNQLSAKTDTGTVRTVGFQDRGDIDALFGDPFSETPSASPSLAPPRQVAPVVPPEPVPPAPASDSTTAPVVSSATIPESTSPPAVIANVTDTMPITGVVPASGVCCDDGSCDSPGCTDAGCSDACGCEPTCSSSCGSACGGGCSLGLCDCELGDAFTLSGLLHGDCPPCVDVGGWASAGFHTRGNDLFNSRPDELAFHQVWLYAEKVADACESPFGFRVDAMYGIDAGDTQAFGNPNGSWDFDNGFDHDDYGWAIPQLYGEYAFGDWSIKAGHFYTLIGYEVVTAPDNFFYSHAMTMYNSEPFTHTGVLATGSLSDSLTVYGGWTLGWDTGFDQLNDGSSWLGGASYAMNDSASLTYISTAGNFGWRGDDAYSHSVVLDLTMTDKLNWVIQSDLVRVASTGEDNVGLNHYFLYSVSDCIGLGARLEWWKGDVLTGYAPHGAVLPTDGSLSYYAATFGANVRPHANLVIRPEVRVDWSPAADYDETYFGIDAVVTF